MNDRAVELLEQYDLEIVRTRKGRGSIICDTENGSYLFKEYAGSEDHAALQNKLLQAIETNSELKTEQIISTKEGKLLVTDTDNVRYVLKTWKDGRECNIGDKKECVEAVHLLANLHEAMRLPPEEITEPIHFSITEEYEKHNREIRKVRKYLKQKGQKQLFERNLLAASDYFMEKALEVSEEWQQYSSIFEQRKCAPMKDIRAEEITYCHGDYQYHNILYCPEGWFLVNFEKCIQDSPIRDLYLLLRKLLEKSNWSIPMGSELIAAYESKRKLTLEDRIDLYYRLAYPEKFWKIMNFYYNSGKAWIPWKNQDKLDVLMDQEKEKQHFLDAVFRKV